MLSFEKSKGAKPIARIKGGEHANKILFLTQKPDKAMTDVKFALADIKSLKLRQNDQARVLQQLNDAVNSGSSGLPPHLLDIFESKMKVQGLKEICLDSGTFEILPNPEPDKRDVVWTCGASGSGKSFIAKSFAEYYRKLFPDREVYLLSQLSADPGTLDKIQPPLKRVRIDSLVTNYPKMEEFADALVILDDIDGLQGKEQKAVQCFMNDISTLSRHHNTSLVVCSHHCTNYGKTRLIINESNIIIVFAQSTALKHLKTLLGGYVGVADSELCELRKKPSRWLCFLSHYPQVCIGEHFARILHVSDK